jgi:hypothetical protein
LRNTSRSLAKNVEKQSDRLDLVSHRFIVIDYKFETLEEGLGVVVLDSEKMLLPRSLVPEHEESSVSIHGSLADWSNVVTTDELFDCAVVNFFDLLLD